MTSPIARRTLLKSLLALSPLALLSPYAQDALLKFLRRHSKPEPLNLKTYVMFNKYGAPARWMFDNCLLPNGDDEIIRHKTIFTGFTDDGKDHYDVLNTPVEYATVPYKDYHVPRMWASRIYHRGDNVPMTALLEHMLTIRGAKQPTDAHPTGNVKQICVHKGLTSISGLAALHSSRPIPALCLGSSPASQAYLCPDDRIGQLEVPYQNGSPDNNILHFLARSFSRENDGYDPVKDYERLMEKYTTIIARNRERCPIVGINDKPLLVKEFAHRDKDSLMKELNRFISDMGEFHLESDYTAFLKKVDIGWQGSLQKQFALAEYAVLNKLSSSIVLAPPALREYYLSGLTTDNYIAPRDLKLKREDGLWKVDFAKSKKRPGTTHIQFDSHVLGSFFANVAPAYYWHSFSACLLEFIQTLKDRSTPEYNYLDNTVIHLASEFERAIPVEDGQSVHLKDSNPTSILSGMIKGYRIVGNIRVESKYPQNNCTLGEAAPVAELGGQPLLTEHVLSSITTVLGGPGLSPRHPSILRVENGEILSNLGRPKNVRV